MLMMQLLAGAGLLAVVSPSPLAVVVGLAVAATVLTLVVLVLVLRRRLIPGAGLLVHTATLGLLLAHALIVYSLDGPANTTPWRRGCVAADPQVVEVARRRQVVGRGCDHCRGDRSVLVDSG